MRWYAPFIPLSALLLSACAGGSPTLEPPLSDAPLLEVPTTTDAWSEHLTDAERANQALTVAEATLNGRTTTDPSYEDEPFAIGVNDPRADYLALIRLTPTAIPSTSHPVLARFTNPNGTLFTTALNSNGATRGVALDLVEEGLTATLYNSWVGGTWPEACHWSFHARTRPAEDPDDNRDDDNPDTITDRVGAPLLQLDRTRSRSLYRGQEGRQDLEDWYRIDLTGGQTYLIDFASDQSWWGTWTSQVRVYDSTGTLVGDGGPNPYPARGFTIAPTLPGTADYYIQVSGTPLTASLGTATILEYTLRVSATSDPQWRSYSLGQQSSPNGLELAVIAGRPIVSWGSGALRIAQSTSNNPQSPADWQVYNVPGASAGLLVSVGGRAFVSSGSNTYAWATTSLPLSSADWVTGIQPPWAGNGRAVLDDHGSPVILRGGPNASATIHRALSPQPASPGDWDSALLLPEIPEYESPLGDPVATAGGAMAAGARGDRFYVVRYFSESDGERFFPFNCRYVFMEATQWPATSPAHWRTHELPTLTNYANDIKFLFHGELPAFGLWGLYRVEGHSSSAGGGIRTALTPSPRSGSDWMGASFGSSALQDSMQITGYGAAFVNNRANGMFAWDDLIGPPESRFSIAHYTGNPLSGGSTQWGIAEMDEPTISFPLEVECANLNEQLIAVHWSAHRHLTYRQRLWGN